MLICTRNNTTLTLKYFALFLITISILNFAEAQNSFLIIDKESNLIFESELISQSDSFHSAIYPKVISEITNYDSIQKSFTNGNSRFLNHYPINIFNHSSRIVPLLNLDLSKDLSGNPSPYKTGMGVLFHSDINVKLSLEFSFYGAKERFDIQNQRQIDNTGILPHIGTYNAQITDAYAYTNWQGYIAYRPYRFLNFQVGKQKNFIGDGYRSLLLSDNSSPYPFIKATVHAGKIQYMVLYQFLKDIDTEFETSPNEAKFSTSHMLSWNIGKRFNINLFETVIWRDHLEPTVHRGYDINYLNPIIFLRPVEFSIGSPDNVIMGGGTRLRLFKNTHLYGQFILDEFKLKEIISDAGWWANKYGYQVGVKIYDLFKIKHLFVLGEYNTVRPFMYSHKTSMENYGNMYQPLAHPLGANFKEVIALANFQKNRWQFQAKICYSKIGIDKDSTNYGQNIYRSYFDNKNEYGNFTLQGLLTRIVSNELKVSYIINPLWNLKVESGIRLYSYSNNNEQVKQSSIFLSFKTLF